MLGYGRVGGTRRLKIVRYAGTAGLAAIVDAGGLHVLLQAGLPLLGAATASFLGAAILNYALTAWFVFGTRPSPRGFAPFLAGALVGLVVNVAITLAGVAFFGTPPVVAKMVGIGVAFLVNFAINAVFVFPQQARGLTGPR